MFQQRTLALSLLAGFLLAAISTSANAADWPQWRGPRRDGGTSETVKPWTATPKTLWRQPVGPGFSSPVIANGKVFVNARVRDKEEEEVIAFNAATGKVAWRDAYSRGTYTSAVGTGPQATPAVAGGMVVSFGISGLLTCHDAETGKRIWQVPVYQKLQAERPRFGVCCSPLVVGDRVFVSVGGKGRAVAAFQVETGEVIWQGFDEPASTSSPVLVPRKGGPPDVVFMTSLRLLAVNPLDGSLSWEYPLVFRPGGASPTPIVAGDLLGLCTTSAGTSVVRVAAKGDKSTASQVWQEKELSGYFSTGVAVGKDHLCLVTNVIEPLPSAALRFVDAKTGKELWKKDAMGYFHIGLLRTGDGKVLSLDDTGVLKLLELTPTECKELAKAKVCGGTFSNPALSGGKLFVRDDKEVLCLDLGQ